MQIGAMHYCIVIIIDWNKSKGVSALNTLSGSNNIYFIVTNNKN